MYAQKSYSKIKNKTRIYSLLLSIPHCTRGSDQDRKARNRNVRKNYKKGR